MNSMILLDREIPYEAVCCRVGRVHSAGRRDRPHGPASGQSNGEAAAIFEGKFPPRHRDWKLISVAHEEGNLNDFRAILGNDVAVTASRKGKPPYPDGSIVARIAWTYHPLEESGKAFGRPQSFVYNQLPAQ